MLYLLRTFTAYIKPYRSYLIVASVFMIFVDLLMYIVPLFIAYVTDFVFPRINEEGVLMHLMLVCLGLLLIGILRGTMVHLMIRNYWRAAESIVRGIRNALYEKFQHLDISYYDNARVGDLMSRATYDVQIIRSFFAFGIEHRLRIFLISAAVLGFMLYQQWRLAAVIYLFLPVFFGIIVYFSNRMRSAVQNRQKQMGRLNAKLQENIAGIRIVKSFAMEEHEKRSFDRENNGMFSADTDVAKLQIHLNAILLLTDGVGSLIIILYGGYQVIQGTMSLGELLAFVGYLGVLAFPIRILAFNTSIINQAKGAGSRVLEILNSPDQKRHNCGSKKDPITGRLEFKNVSFMYTSGSPILRDISFSLEPGEHVALFGLTGAGKSTLISQIPRFYPPDSGEITIDNIPITDWDMHHLRSQIGTVLQETFLFSASICENIAFGRPGASAEEVKEAARNAQIHDFIMSLPDGYDTQVGEYGIGLSGGQKQRIAIARTLLQDPRLLILDDCTSSLDAVTERKIQKQLRTLMTGRTTIIIAQRISTLALADRIIVLDEGSITDIDSHERLLERN
ncbi:MAG: ABC transporter ATP-binding protein, partial [Spirochaetota bacterium]